MRTTFAPIVLLPLLVGALVACDGRRRAASTGHAPHEEPRSGATIAVLDLSGGVPEQAATGLLGLPAKSVSMEDVVQETARLARDKHVRGALVRLGTARFGLARAQEVGAMLSVVGARIPVWCHADDLSNGTLLLAARACKKVWVSPASTVDAVGLAAQTIYFHRLLADELKLDVDFLQIGKYKGAEEPFTRDGPSPEARASLESTLADMRAVWLDGIRTARPAVADGAAEDGPYGARDARAGALVDEVGYLDEAREALEKEAGAVRSEVRLGPGAGAGAGGDDLSDLLRALAGESLGAAPVALVRAIGAISMDGSGGLFGDGGGVVERRLVRTLARLAKDDDVKAVVLRIDSPGGSALASDLLWHELMRIREQKPLVVSVGGMAASGGYYLASAGAVIFADETSIVGSIGVVGGKIAADHALERIGVHAETIPAKVGDPRAASRAAFESLLAPWDDATRDRMRKTMTDIYELFVARVAEGRKMDVAKVAASAEGRIFSGREGKARGLVDELGGLPEAIARARAMAGLAADARVAVAGDSGGLLETLADDEPSSSQGTAPFEPAGRSSSPGSALVEPADPLDRDALAPIVAAAVRLSPELKEYLASLAPMVGREHALCALPFALAVH
jgi:protease-4